MSKIFLILSAVLVLISAGLSFANKGKLTTSLDDARAAHSEVNAAKADAAKAKTAMTKAQAEAKESVTKAADAQGQLAGVQSQVTDLEGKVKTANDAAAAKDAQIADLNTKIQAAVGTGVKDPNASTIAQQIDELKRSRDELQVVKDGLETELKGSRAQLAKVQKNEQDRQSGIAMVGLQGRVLAVDRNWNFVVLSVGDRNGVSNNATLIIQRGGSLVGKARITSVEPSQSIADIIPNSVPAGVSVQAGDTVVYSGS